MIYLFICLFVLNQRTEHFIFSFAVVFPTLVTVFRICRLLPTQRDGVLYLFMTLVFLKLLLVTLVSVLVMGIALNECLWSPWMASADGRKFYFE